MLILSHFNLFMYTCADRGHLFLSTSSQIIAKTTLTLKMSDDADDTGSRCEQIQPPLGIGNNTLECYVLHFVIQGMDELMHCCRSTKLKQLGNK